MKAKIWLGIIISGVFIWLAFREIDYHALWDGLLKADYRYVIPATLITLAQLFLRAIRWGHLIEPIKKVGAYNLFSATAIGFMANNILPARMGEVVKAFALGKQEKVSVSASFATIILERLIDLLVVFIFMLFVLYMVSLPYGDAKVEAMLRQGGTTLFLIFLAILCLLFYFKSHKEFFKKIVNGMIRPLSPVSAERISQRLDSFATGLLVLKRGRHLLPITTYSLIIWIVSALPVYLILISYGYRLPFSISLFILVILALTVAIPSAPGFVGTFHYACALGLGLFGIPQEEALSIAIILHAINFFPITLLGLYFLWHHNMTLKEMERLEEAT